MTLAFVKLTKTNQATTRNETTSQSFLPPFMAQWCSFLGAGCRAIFCGNHHCFQTRLPEHPRAASSQTSLQAPSRVDRHRRAARTRSGSCSETVQCVRINQLAFQRGVPLGGVPAMRVAPASSALGGVCSGVHHPIGVHAAGLPALSSHCPEDAGESTFHMLP